MKIEIVFCEVNYKGGEEIRFSVIGKTKSSAAQKAMKKLAPYLIGGAKIDKFQGFMGYHIQVRPFSEFPWEETA